MSEQSRPPSKSRRLQLTRSDVQTLLLVALVLLAASVFYHEIRSAAAPSSKTTINTADGVTPDEADAIMTRANDAANFVSNLLNFLEVAFAAITLGLAGGAWILRGMILDQVDKSNQLGERIDQQFKGYEDHLKGLEDRLNKTLQGMSSSFRVLSLQLLAEQQVRAHNIDTAIDTLQAALRIDRDDHGTNYLLGYLYTQRKQIDLAIEHLKHALDLESDFTPGIAALGLALRRKGDSLDSAGRHAERDRYWEEAEAKLLEALAKDRRLTDADGESYYGTLGGLYRRQERYYAALDAYERAHQVTPSSSYPVINLASIHKHEGNEEKARHYFEQVVKAALLQLDDDPRNAWARCDLAQAELVLGETEEAFDQIHVVIEQEPEPGVLETVHSGLSFLAESPQPIQGVEDMIRLIDEALTRRDTEKQQAAAQANGSRQDQAG
ncbi:MAG TPA: hypothetical protein VMT24_17260 [Aggregatilineaceae bacterium]|nr:hypothetical protein [Aggregatilineaceae bacterium]